MSEKKCVLFDMDGTLFDTSEGIKMCYRYGLEHFGITVKDDSELDRVIGPSLYDSYHEFYGLEGDDLKEAVRLYRELYSRKGIYKLRMYDGVEDMICSIKQDGHIIGLATTKPYVMADKILGFSGLKHYFDVICGSNLDGSMSDKYLLINTCLAQCGFTDKSRVYMVGDRFYDIEGAKAVGVHPVGVTYGFGCREEFLEAGAEYIVDSPKEVARMITDSI